MKNEYLLSIVIATHNRQKYAVHSIESILAYTHENVEVVVSDTSESDSLKSLLEKYSHISRLKYTHHTQRLSMTENYNFAVESSMGEYVCLIGDDDSVCPEIERVIELMKEREVSVLSPRIIATYSWPDFITKVWGDKHAGKLYIDKFSGDWKRCDSKKKLQQALRNACQGTDELPKLYHGIVQKTLLEKIKEKNGNYFLGISPDISIAISLAAQTEEYYTLDYPVTIPGASGGSNTGRSALNKHKGSLDDDEHIKPFKDIKWDERIPRFFSVETTWSQAAIETLHVYNLADKFNFARLISLCQTNHAEYGNKIAIAKRNCEELGVSISLSSLIMEKVKLKLNRLKNILIRLKNPTPSGGKSVIANCENINEAVDKYVEFMNAK
ncbi:glycosyltransferase family 2 protein [Vibrio anguillarum]|uniref:Glycosyltransferase n=1 Tax=Vibrio ordalii FS-238 TaxID=617133 RepID=A0A853R0C7_9VIBR|nr:MULTISPECIES: glycosyltransferase family 2 protein [Vibrio]MDQ2192059.1 glycosyltransferase family 2 protein [Vibrio sp. A14(2019)]MDQ2197066.1 glycosyltransferase family 2 protein [Vibrio sp. 2017_1457_11]NNN76229.1 glycosyltransferase family 2 protein [Vibrio sp. B7]NNN92820.1 glycosyltransferase family 2 protein [Vibrio sp. B8-1]NNO08329.1 glycosyltransferase family 2 protein [Vibrio sp. B4-12]